jgi:murein L,D-transpeptidase YafK
MKQRVPAKIKFLAFVLAALAFLCLPALFAFAGADELPRTARSDAAYAQNAPSLRDALRADGLDLGQPVYMRITKQPAELTAYVAAADGAYHAFRTWPVCSVSGDLGPKVREGDGQAPEGFYSVTPAAMNPASRYHLSFNLGFPNAHDQALGHTGSYLMVHGACVSVGCFAMTDVGIAEIWTLMQAAFDGGQAAVPVHIFPFPMTPENLQGHAGEAPAAFWQSLAPAWDAFETTARVPVISAQGGVYMVRAAQ